MSGRSGCATRTAGFTLIELLIVVAIIGIIAAIAIPSLLRARVSANESATLGDIRTLISAEAAYHSANGGFYGPPDCLVAPCHAGCIPSYPTNGADLPGQPARGRDREERLQPPFEPGTPTGLRSDMPCYAYHATPVMVGPDRRARVRRRLQRHASATPTTARPSPSVGRHLAACNALR